MAADGIPTLQDFIQLLPEMTMIMLKRYRKDAPAHPPKGPRSKGRGCGEPIPRISEVHQ